MEEQTRKALEKSIYNRTTNLDRPAYGSFWNRSLYDQMMALEYEPDLERLAQQNLTNKTVLILGGGPGEVELVRRFTTDITSVNISDKAVADLQQRFPEVHALVADAEKLDELGGSFDAVYCKSILHHLHPLDSVLAAIARKLKPDGVLLVAMEPGLLNPFAAFGRRFTPSQSHTPGEQPLIFSKFHESTRQHFDVVYENQYFLWSMLLPILAKRVPSLERAVRTGITSSVALERTLARIVPMRDLYWVMMGVYKVRDASGLHAS